MARKRLILILSAILICPLLVSAGKDNELLAKAEQNMSKIKTLQAEFVQQRKIKLLKHAIEFKGMFFLESSGKIAWQVYSPVRYSCIISNNSITQWDDDSKQQTIVSAEKNSALRLVFKQLNRWFAGKFSDLRKDFDYSADTDKNKLLFVPKKGAPQKAFIKSISIFMNKSLNYINRIEIVEKNDDTQVIDFYNTVINQKLPETAWKTGK